MGDLPENPFPEDSVSEETEVSQTKQESAFSNISLDITLDDLKEPGTQRLLVWHHEQLRQRNEALSIFQIKYYQNEQSLAELKAKSQSKKSYEILYGSLLIIGSALVGIGMPPLDEFVWTWHSTVNLILGLGLVAGGIYSRIVEK